MARGSDWWTAGYQLAASSMMAEPEPQSSASSKGGDQVSLPEHFLDADRAPVSGGPREERTIVPGVYFTPGGGGSDGGRGSQHEGGQDAEEMRYAEIATMGRDALIHREREVVKSVAKLKESNKEMLEFDPDGKDEDLVQAREENAVAIKRQEDRLEMMRRRLEFLDPLDHAKP